MLTRGFDPDTYLASAVNDFLARGVAVPAHFADGGANFPRYILPLVQEALLNPPSGVLPHGRSTVPEGRLSTPLAAFGQLLDAPAPAAAQGGALLAQFPVWTFAEAEGAFVLEGVRVAAAVSAAAANAAAANAAVAAARRRRRSPSPG